MKGYQFLECRAQGHEWHHAEAILSGIASGVVGLVSTCQTCGMERTRWVTRNGSFNPPTYKQPDGYRTSGDDRQTLQEWRRDRVARFWVKGKRK